MKSVTVIIDFDNYFGNDMTKLSSIELELSFSELIELCEREFPSLETISIRLYGGWYHEMSLTKQASTLQQMLYDVNVFPVTKKRKVINGQIEIISSLFGISDFIWGYTYKETEGIKPVRINFECVDDICNSNRQQCPKFIINKFTKSKEKKCSLTGCENIQKNVFKGVEQKMVDTLIACDIISITEDENCIGLVVLSDDQDHFPSLALAKEKQKNNRNSSLEEIILLIQNDQKIDFIKDFLCPFNIKIQLVP